MDREVHMELSGPYHSWRSSQVKIQLISKWLDEVKMEESHAMDNDHGGVGGHILDDHSSSYVDDDEDGGWMLVWASPTWR